MKIIRLILIVSFLAVATQAQIGYLNYNKMHYGQQTEAYSARMLGLAGSGLALSGACGQGIDNPALIVGEKTGWSLNAGFAVNKLIENREYPYYDSFVGFNDYGSYAYNANWYYDPYFNLRFSHKNKWGLFAVQAGFTPFLDFRYDYTEEVRDPVNKSDQLLGYNWIKQDGVLNLSYLGVGYQPLKNLSVGLNIGLLWGSVDSTRQIEPKVSEAFLTRSVDQRSRSLQSSPVVVNFGLHYQLNDRLGIAYSMRFPYKITFDGQVKNASDTSLTKYGESVTYPLRLGAGIDYRFRNILQARVFVDFYYEFWSQFEDTRLNTNGYRDVYTIRAGVEHIFFDKLPFRVGFAFNQLPENPDLTRTLLTVGTGWHVGAANLNAAAGIVHEQFFQPDIFPDTIYGLPARTDLDRVTWTQYFLRLDLSYHLFD